MMPIPLTVVGGFLGAGKTTLVNDVLAQSRGRRLAVLINDFGALSIDAALIAATGARSIALANGCVCCTLVDGLVQALIDVLALDPPPEHVLVEASGVSDPRRIAQIARADRSFLQDATIVVAAADQIEALARDRYVGDTVLRQLAAADLIVLNKLDCVDAGAAHATSAWLGTVAPAARLLRAIDARVACDVVLGPVTMASGPDSSCDAASFPAHATDDHGGAFATRTLRCARPLSERPLRAALAALPECVLRVKGFVRFDTAPGALHLVQRVGARCTIAEAPPQACGSESVLVLIAAAPALARADLAPLARVFA